MRKLIPVIVSVLALSALGCEQNDLGRYCVVGQPVPNFNANVSGQPSVTVLNIEAPECNDRICLRQGPFKEHPTAESAENCPEPYYWDSDHGCIYDVKAFCTSECNKHKDCKAGSQDANGNVCTQYVCHKQKEGEAFEGHCICVCKDFLIDPDADPPAFYKPEDQVPEPSGCN
jgi:hypothetical protein